MFKNCSEDRLSGNIKNDELEDYTEEINDIEKKLNKPIKSKSMKSKNIDKLKKHVEKINYLVYGKGKERIKTDQAKSFENLKYILIIVQNN